MSKTNFNSVCVRGNPELCLERPLGGGNSYSSSPTDDKDDQEPEKHGDDHRADGNNQLHVGLFLRT